MRIQKLDHGSRLAVCLALLLSLTGALQAQTFLVVTRETRDGELVPRPLFSQEGFMSAMFDLGYVSFDTGPYEPQVGWEEGDYREPLDIASSGLADYLAVARLDSLTLSAAGSAPKQPLQITTRVRYELLDVSGRSLGRGELTLLGSGEEDPAGGTASDPEQASDYRRAMLRAGQALARESLRLLAGAR